MGKSAISQGRLALATSALVATTLFALAGCQVTSPPSTDFPPNVARYERTGEGASSALVKGTLLVTPECVSVKTDTGDVYVVLYPTDELSRSPEPSFEGRSLDDGQDVEYSGGMTTVLPESDTFVPSGCSAGPYWVVG